MPSAHTRSTMAYKPRKIALAGALGERLARLRQNDEAAIGSRNIVHQADEVKLHFALLRHCFGGGHGAKQVDHRRSLEQRVPNGFRHESECTSNVPEPFGSQTVNPKVRKLARRRAGSHLFSRVCECAHGEKCPVRRLH